MSALEVLEQETSYYDVRYVEKQQYNTFGQNRLSGGYISFTTVTSIFTLFWVFDQIGHLFWPAFCLVFKYAQVKSFLKMKAAKWITKKRHLAVKIWNFWLSRILSLMYFDVCRMQKNPRPTKYVFFSNKMQVKVNLPLKFWARQKILICIFWSFIHD